MICPGFRSGHLAGFVVSCIHLADIGGPAPGTQAVDGVTEGVQEGLRLLPARLCREGEPVREIFDLIGANVRVSELVLGDVRAQRAALQVGATKLAQYHGQGGSPVVDAAAEAFLAQSEQAVRRELFGIPDRTATFVDYLDDYGPGSPPIRLEVAVTISGSDLLFEFTGTDPQTPSSLNCTLSYLNARCYWIAKAITTRGTIPQNEGQLRPLRITAPQGCFFNPLPPRRPERPRAVEPQDRRAAVRRAAKGRVGPRLRGERPVDQPDLRWNRSCDGTHVRVPRLAWASARTSACSRTTSSSRN